MKKFLAHARERAVKRELNKLISACENGDDMSEALIVSPLSDLDVRYEDGWKRPDGVFYNDYIIDKRNKGEIHLLQTTDDNVNGIVTTKNHLLSVDKEYRDWQEPSGTLYEERSI